MYKKFDKENLIIEKEGYNEPSCWFMLAFTNCDGPNQRTFELEIFILV